MSEEIWRQCVDKNYQPIEGYEVSSLGRVRSLDRFIEQKSRNGNLFKRFFKGSLLKLTAGSRGYLLVDFHDQGYWLVHILVALAFPEICGSFKAGLEVDHKDGMRTNNMAENLRFVTSSQNKLNPSTYERFVESSRSNITKTRTENSRFKRSLTVSKPVVADGLTQVFMNTYTMAEYLGVTHHAVYQALKNNWKVCGFTVRYAGVR